MRIRVVHAKCDSQKYFLQLEEKIVFVQAKKIK